VAGVVGVAGVAGVAEVEFDSLLSNFYFVDYLRELSAIPNIIINCDRRRIIPSLFYHVIIRVVNNLQLKF